MPFAGLAVFELGRATFVWVRVASREFGRRIGRFAVGRRGAPVIGCEGVSEGVFARR